MKKSAIKIDQDIVMRLNAIKYKWQMKTQSQVLRRLIEIASRFETADKFNASFITTNSDSPDSFLTKTKSNTNGAVVDDKEKRKC